MKKAKWSALVAVLCVLGMAAQETQKPAQPEIQPKPAATQETQPPATPTPAPNSPDKTPAAAPDKAAADPDTTKVDPTKMAAPAAAGKTKPANAGLVDAKSYVLGAEDQISITVWRSPEFSGQHMIRPDGKITINLIGEVEAAGHTPEKLGEDIKERLRKVLVDPDVSVSVIAVNSKRFFIQGEVLKPGEYKLVVPTRVLQALVNAGGFKDFANQKKITIMRGTQRFNFNYKAVIAGKNLDQNIWLEPDDLIIVK